MKVKVRKILRILFIIALLFTTTIIAIVIYLYCDANDGSDEEISLIGQHGAVQILLNQYGIPKIISKNSDQDVFFGLGFMHAKNRFWQMELQRHIVKGSLSEIFGKETLEEDKFLRTWGFYRSATNDWHSYNATTKEIINSYTAGINYFLKTSTTPIQLKILNYKPEPWTNIDSVAWAKMIAWQLQNSWKDKIENYLLNKKYGKELIQSLKVPYPSNAPTVMTKYSLQAIPESSSPKHDTEHETIAKSKSSGNHSIINIARINLKLEKLLNSHNVSGKGSNCVVIAGHLTATGHPILANDIHLDLSAPTLWYQAVLHGPQLHVVGATIPGLPAIIIGHNENIGWGITNAGLDAQDIYLISNNEKLNTITETIRVKGANPIYYKILQSSVGPILNEALKLDNANDLLAVKWTALQPGDTTVQSLLKLNYAQNWQQFKDALNDYVAPSQNFIYADKNNIGYYLPGLIPIRNGWTGTYPVSLDAKHMWSGFIPFNELPQAFNPPEGFIASANNKAVPEGYKHSLTYHWIESPYRIQRLVDLLGQKQTMDVATIMKLQIDTNSYFWDAIKPSLLKTKAIDPASEKALNILRSWNGDMALDSIGATIFAAWFEEIKEIQPKPTPELLSLTSPLFIINQLQNESNYCKIYAANSCDHFLSLSLQRAVNNLNARLGKDINHWQWKFVHIAKFNAPVYGEIKFIGKIWRREIPRPGDSFTLNVGAYDKNFTQIAGATYRQIIDFSEIENSYFIQALGQSDNPLSRHYADQLKLWDSGKYLSMSSST